MIKEYKYQKRTEVRGYSLPNDITGKAINKEVEAIESGNSCLGMFLNEEVVFLIGLYKKRISLKILPGHIPQEYVEAKSENFLPLQSL